jgi:hypothetical protein
MSDHLENHLQPVPKGSINIEWTNVVGDPRSAEKIEFCYGKPMHVNWSSSLNEPQPVNEVRINFNPKTNAGSIQAIFR